MTMFAFQKDHYENVSENIVKNDQYLIQGNLSTDGGERTDMRK